MGHFARVCRARQVYTRPPQPPGPRTPSTPSTRSLQMAQIDDTQLSQLSTIRQVTTTESAPTVSIRILSINGSCETQALPDSGADISVAGPQLLHSLSEHALNLLPSKVTPHTANGHKMQPLGKLPVTFQLQGRNYSEDMHIYPDIPGVIMSWKAAKGLRILQMHYPDPAPDIATRDASNYPYS